MGPVSAAAGTLPSVWFFSFWHGEAQPAWPIGAGAVQLFHNDLRCLAAPPVEPQQRAQDPAPASLL